MRTVVEVTLSNIDFKSITTELQKFFVEHEVKIVGNIIVFENVQKQLPPCKFAISYGNETVRVEGWKEDKEGNEQPLHEKSSEALENPDEMTFIYMAIFDGLTEEVDKYELKKYNSNVDELDKTNFAYQTYDIPEELKKIVTEEQKKSNRKTSLIFILIAIPLTLISIFLKSDAISTITILCWVIAFACFWHSFKKYK